MLKIENGQIVSDCGKEFRKIGEESVFGKRCLLKDETLDMFEEVDERPPFTESQYKAKVAELIARKYTLADEIAIERQKETKPEQWQTHFDYCEQCKAEAKAILSEQRFDNV